MKRHPVFPVWFTVWLVAVVGGGSLAFGANVTAIGASNAAFAEHLEQLRVPEGFIVVLQPTVCDHRR